MNDPVLETILARSSIREYTGEALSDEQLLSLKRAALASPTAMNRQDQRFLFVTNADAIERINSAVMEAIEASGNEAFLERIRSRGGRILYSPPLFVAIFSRDSHYAGVDAGIAVENLALAAKGLGLDSVILGMPSAAFEGERGRALAASLGVPDGFFFRIAISIGHRAAEKTPHEWDEAHIITVD